GLKRFVDDDNDKYLIPINVKLEVLNEERTILANIIGQSQYDNQKYFVNKQIYFYNLTK
ncbi:unnamed protein product, partial [Rotaria sordida]